MRKKNYFAKLCNIYKVIFVVLSFTGILIFPKDVAAGVKEGLLLSGENVIPSLFPFMVLSTYISFNPATERIAKIFNKITQRLFSANGNGIVAFILGALGGYPIGAKTICEFYQNNKLSKDEVSRLLCWCVNPSPAFVITAVGTFMLNSTQCGLIMYFSVIAASFTIGLCVKFLGAKTEFQPCGTISADQKNIFVNSVASGSKAMLSVCSWVLVFSAVTKVLEKLIRKDLLHIFISSVAEITVGCSTLIKNNISVPVICAALGFGGFAVIFQIAPYLEKCNFSLKHFICWRIITGALSAFYCSQILKLFPMSLQVYKAVSIGSATIHFSHSITATIILLVTCTVLILEVDYRRKVC